MPATPVDDVLRFDGYTLHLGRRELHGEKGPIELGARAFDLLRTLAQNPGRLLTKAELFASAWPGVTVDENNLQVQISALRKILGPKLIATVPGRGYQFTINVATKAPEPPREEAAPPSALIGRAKDLEQLKDLVAGYPLVTIQGPGGVGKTVLAQALADASMARFGGNVTMVELAPVSDPALVPAAVAGSLGFKPASGPLGSQIAAHLADKEQLLILDNCEHQIAAVTALIEEVASAAPKLHIATTTQARLGLSRENVYVLEPLATPNDVTLYQVEQSPAAILFATRAAQSAPGFQIVEANAEAIKDICHRLDGIPLALELAAARVGLLGAEGVRTRLDQRLKLLTKGPRNVVPRHATLRTALEWSYDLLTADEQFVFRQLGAFRGGFTGSDVQAVTICDTVDEWAALDALSTLIDRSLVARKPGGDASTEPRFTLLETMAEFAVAKSSEAGEIHAVRARHAAHFTALAVAVGGRRPERDTRVNRDYTQFDLQHDNLRAAFDWSFTHDLAKAFNIGDSMAVYWRLRGHLNEGLGRLEALLATTDPHIGERTRGLVLSSAQGLCYETQNADRLESIADTGITLWTTLDDPFELAMATAWKGHSYALRSDFQTALSYYEVALPLFRRANHPGRIAEMQSNIANALIELGRPNDAGRAMSEALSYFQTTDDKWGEAFCREVIGLARFATGDVEECKAEWLAARDRFDQVGHDYRSVLARLNLAALALLTLDQTAARTCLADAMDRLGERFYKTEISAAIHLGAQYCSLFDEMSEAATLLASAYHWTKHWNIHLELPTAFGVEAAEARIRAGLTAETLAAATSAGTALPAHAALARLRGVLRKE